MLSSYIRDVRLSRATESCPLPEFLNPSQLFECCLQHDFSQKGTGMSPLWGIWLTLDHPFWAASHPLAHERVPSNAVTRKSPGPPACKHKLRKRLQQERQFASMLTVKVRFQIPAHFLLRVTAEQELQFLVLGGIGWLFFCGVRNSTLEYPFQDTQIWHIKHFGISKRS